MSAESSGYIAHRLRVLHTVSSFAPRPPLPKTLMVETTSGCNQRCVFCAQSFKQRPTGFLDLGLYSRLVEEATAAGMTELGLYTTGEPFLDKRLAEFVRLAKQAGFSYVYASTNGALMSEERLVPVLDAGLDSIKVSFNAGTRAGYERVHRRDDFDRVLANLRRLVELREQRAIPLRIMASTILTAPVAGEEQQVRQLLGPLVDEHVVARANHQNGQMVEAARELQIPEDVPTQAVTLPGPQGPCFMLWNRVHVTQEGLLTLCCVDYENELTYADLSKQSLLEAWHNATMQEWRRRHREEDLGETRCAVCVEAWREQGDP